MSRTITALSLAAAAVLALSSCATADHTQHGVVTPASAPTQSTHTGHPSSSPPSAGAPAPSEHSEHTASEHAEHEATASATASASAPESEHADEPAGHDDHSKRDDTYKDVALQDGTTYTIQSSTDQTTFKLTVVSFECKDPFPRAGVTASGKVAQFKADAGKVLCVAMISGKNIGDKPDHAALNYFAVAVDDDGTEYEETDSPDFTTQFLVKGKTPLDQPVDPGDTGWIALGYELPTTGQSVSLRIDTAPASH